MFLVFRSDVWGWVSELQPYSYPCGCGIIYLYKSHVFSDIFVGKYCDILHYLE